jgi:hypothetical protein
MSSLTLRLVGPRDGTTHPVVSPLEFMQRLVALIPCRGCT